MSDFPGQETEAEEKSRTPSWAAGPQDKLLAVPVLPARPPSLSFLFFSPFLQHFQCTHDGLSLPLSSSFLPLSTPVCRGLDKRVKESEGRSLAMQ